MILRTFLLLFCFSFLICSCQKNVVENISEESILVKAGNVSAIDFYVPIYAKKPQLVGVFKASGGSGNDIICYLMRKVDYSNWVNGHNADIIWSSGKLTMKDMIIDLSPGEYYTIVYDNRFSLFSDKLVIQKLRLIYQKYFFEKN